MAKKKKSTTPAATATAINVTSSTKNTNEKTTEQADVSADDIETSVELLQVDTGDMVKVKQVLDEAVAGAFLDTVELTEDHRLENMKLGIMTVACIFAMVAQFAPMPFPESRPVLGICCASYFILSGVLQLIATFVDKDAIMVTLPTATELDYGKVNKDMTRYGLRIRTSFPRFDEFYSIVIEFEKKPDTPFVKKTWSVGKFFDGEGFFDEIALIEEVEGLFQKFKNKNYDKEKSTISDSGKKKNQ